MSNEPFAGFPVPTKNFFSMPNEMINIIAHIKNVAELKVIIYVIRHTWGYHEYGICKMISVDEFQHGRRRSDGSRMDEGTGLSHHSVIDGLKAAVNDGYLICEMDASDLARVKKSYALKMISSSADTSPGAEFAPPEEFAPGAESSNSSANSAPSSEESALRSEKDTIRKTPKKDTKKESNAGSSEPAAPASSSQSKPINFSEAQERKKATDEHKAITQEMLAEKVIAPKITLPSKQKTAASADGEAVVQPPQSQAPGQPDVAPPASVGASTAQAGAGKRTQEKQKVTQADEIPPEAVRIMNDWDATRKKPAPRTKKHVDAALLLVPFNPSQEDLRACERWLYTTDRPGKPWYRLHGVSLSDIAENISKWQSLQEQQAPNGQEAFVSKTLDKERNDRRIDEAIAKAQKIRAERQARAM